MLNLINWRLKVTLNDGRALTGQMLAFDRHMNLVLADCEEFRRVRPKKKPGEETAPEQEMKRTLGLVILRGETVVSLSVEGPPPAVDEDKKNTVNTTFSPAVIKFDRHRVAPCWSWPGNACWPWDGHDASKCALSSFFRLPVY
jgi:small nuclear ribonucleoprotein B and B'